VRAATVPLHGAAGRTPVVCCVQCVRAWQLCAAVTAAAVTAARSAALHAQSEAPVAEVCTHCAAAAVPAAQCCGSVSLSELSPPLSTFLKCALHPAFCALFKVKGGEVGRGTRYFLIFYSCLATTQHTHSFACAASGTHLNTRDTQR
jgi:hypothetical protein